MQNTIFDISHHQGHVDFVKASTAGMRAVIVKATEGTTWTDNLYQANVAQAGPLGAGLLLGAYHFGNNSLGVDQANHFLSITDAQLLRVLDFEANSSQMTVEQAESFVQQVWFKTGKWPIIYADHSHAEQLAASPMINSNCPLWLAQYRDPSTPPPPPHGWHEYKLWQYTDQGTIEGLSQKFDRSAFMGEDLETWWKEQTS